MSKTKTNTEYFRKIIGYSLNVLLNHTAQNETIVLYGISTNANKHSSCSCSNFIKIDWTTFILNQSWYDNDQNWQVSIIWKYDFYLLIFVNNWKLELSKVREPSKRWKKKIICWYRANVCEFHRYAFDFANLKFPSKSPAWLCFARRKKKRNE